MSKQTHEMLVICMTKHVEYVDEFDPVFFLTEIEPSGKIRGVGSPERAQGFAGASPQERQNTLALVRSVWPDARFVRVYVSTFVEELTD